MLKTYTKDGKVFLTWGHHDLAFSVRTSGWVYPIWDENGILLTEDMYSCKSAGRFELPQGAHYILVRYFSNSGKPGHTLYQLPSFAIIAQIGGSTTYEDIDAMINVPSAIREYIAGDIF